MGARFEYVSGIRIGETFDRNVPWEIDIKNVGDEAGLCSVNCYRRVYVTVVDPPRWSGWHETSGYYQQSAILDPGDTVTFSGYFHTTSWRRQYMVVSEAGTILEPSEPKLYICRCCMLLGKGTVSFDTQEELDAHYATAHPEYAPMVVLTHFELKGIAWPDHFTKYGEDYGAVVSWDAVVCLDENNCPPDSGWSGALIPDEGQVSVPTSQALHFTMPAGWVSARYGICGAIPNSLKIRIGGFTDLGWSAWIGDSPMLERIPENSLITFECYEKGCRNWKVEEPELEPQFSEFTIADYSKV